MSSVNRIENRAVDVREKANRLKAELDNLKVDSAPAAAAKLSSAQQEVQSIRNQLGLVKGEVDVKTSKVDNAGVSIGRTNKQERLDKTTEEIREIEAILADLDAKIQTKANYLSASTGMSVNTILTGGCDIDATKKEATAAAKRIYGDMSWDTFQQNAAKAGPTALVSNGLHKLSEMAGGNMSQEKANQIGSAATTIGGLALGVYILNRIRNGDRKGALKAVGFAGAGYVLWNVVFGDGKGTTSSIVNNHHQINGVLPGSHAEVSVSEDEGYVRTFFDTFNNFDVIKPFVSRDSQGQLKLDAKGLKAKFDADPELLKKSAVSEEAATAFIPILNQKLQNQGELDQFNESLNKVLGPNFDPTTMTKSSFNSHIKGLHENHNEALRTSILAKGYEITNMKLLNDILTANKLADGTPLNETDETARLGQLERAGAIKKAKNGTEAQIAANESMRGDFSSAVEKSNFGQRLSKEKRDEFVTQAITLSSRFGIKIFMYGENGQNDLYIENGTRAAMLRAGSSESMYLNILNNQFDTSDPADVLKQAVMLNKITKEIAGTINMEEYLQSDGTYAGPFYADTIGGLKAKKPGLFNDNWMREINSLIDEIPSYKGKLGSLALYLNNIRVITGSRYIPGDKNNPHMTDKNVVLDTRYYNPKETNGVPLENTASLWDPKTAVPAQLVAKGGSQTTVETGRGNPDLHKAEASAILHDGVDWAGEYIEGSIQRLTRDQNEARDLLVKAACLIGGYYIGGRLFAPLMAEGASVGSKIGGGLLRAGAIAGSGMWLAPQIISELKKYGVASTEDLKKKPLSPEQQSKQKEQININEYLTNIYGSQDSINAINKVTGEERAKEIIKTIAGVSQGTQSEELKDVINLIKIIQNKTASSVAAQNIFAGLTSQQKKTAENAFMKFAGGTGSKDFVAVCQYIKDHSSETIITTIVS